MAYVRNHGNQVAIVHGIRDKKTRKVKQKILFSFYSQEEAREAIEENGKKGCLCFRSLLENQYPKVSFDWKKITAGIKESIDILPETYAIQEERVHKCFRESLRGFARQLIWTDPQQLFPSAEVIRDNRYELEFFRELIEWRLGACEQSENEWNRDNQFYWRYELHGNQVPAEVEELVEEYYERGDLDRADACFRLLIESFEDYAEGYNYLGLIACDRYRYDEAIKHFSRTVEVGKRLFPRRVRKSDWWNDLSTRPYMRGLRNLSLAFNRAGQYQEALDVCECLEGECGDDVTAMGRRSEIYLNLGEWEKAFKAAEYTRNIYPGDSFYAAFALRELGREKESLSFFLHGALNFPRAARLILNIKTLKPKSSEEVKAHKAGVAILENISGYLKKRFVKSKRFFRKIVQTSEVTTLLEEVEEVVRRRNKEHSNKDRTAFERMVQLQSSEFAEQKARVLASVLL